MNYQLIAIDLDGTALSSNAQVQQSTIDAVRYARERGVKVVLCTGRICSEAADFAKVMDTDDEMITAGGAMLARLSDGAMLNRISMNWEAAAKVADVLEDSNFVTMTYVGAELFMTPCSEAVFNAYKTNEGFLAVKRVVPSVAQYLRENKPPVEKVFSRCANAPLLANARKQIEKIPGLHVMSSAIDNIEVVAPQTDKGSALIRLCKQYGISIENVIAIGDSENDLEMLEVVGMPVAMGNSDERVKSLAKYITSDNNHGGVAQAIYHFIK